MLVVDTYVAASPIHGVGLFSSKDIKQGEKVWDFQYPGTFITSEDQIADKPESYKKFVRYYGSLVENEMIEMYNDNARFTNHSDNPNVVVGEEPDTMVAARDIKAGEELTEDYRQYDIPSRENIDSVLNRSL